MPDNQSNVPRIEQIIEWDVENWSQALPFWTAHSKVAVTTNARALELGSRHGGLSLWLAFRGFSVVCSDVDQPTARATALHDSYGFASRVTYARVDATAITAHGQFDVVCFKSMLGAVGRRGIAAQRLAVEEMYRVLCPGGEVWFAENLRASPFHRILRRLFVPWARSWRYPTLSELTELFGRFSSLEIVTVGCFAAFGRTEKQRSFLALLDNLRIMSVVPSTWRYVAIGVARK